MRALIFATLLCAAIGTAGAQQLPQRTFGWVRASDEVVQLDPADYHAGRVYHAGPDGGNMHVIIQAKRPVTLAMVDTDGWNAAQRNPEAWARFANATSNVPFEAILQGRNKLVFSELWWRLCAALIAFLVVGLAHRSLFGAAVFSTLR